MEPVPLGFAETHAKEVVEDKSHSSKLVPWISWEEWRTVKDSLFSSSPHSVAKALQRISTWKSRGCIPVVIEVTASIIEIQQIDPSYRHDLTPGQGALLSDNMLSMLYCMAIIRLVNGMVEKTRKKSEISIGEAADIIGIPRMLIDIRHEASHRDLPSLELVRAASGKALEWLRSYYWEPQERAVPVQSNHTATIRKEIKRRLRELAFYLKAKQTARSSASSLRGKRSRHVEPLCGLNKFAYLASMKASHSKSTDFKKPIMKSLRNIRRLYSSHSSEVVYILLEFLLKALDSLDLAVDSEISCSDENKPTAYDDWTSVIMKLSKAEPELLLTLLKGVLEKIETQEDMKYELGDHHIAQNLAEPLQIDLLSCLFERLIEKFKSLNPVSPKDCTENQGSPREANLLKTTLLGLLHKCLLLSASGNRQLMAAALVLAQMTGKKPLLDKLTKLNSIFSPNSDFIESDSVDSPSQSLLSEHEDYIRQAEEKLELIRNSKTKRGKEKQTDSDVSVKRRWGLAKSWNPCPLGMLPHSLGFSGRPPVLDCKTENDEVGKSDDKTKSELNPCGKREAEYGTEELDNTSKKMKESEEISEFYDHEDNTLPEGVKGHLMTGGVWQKVTEKDLFDIKSAVRLLV